MMQKMPEYTKEGGKNAVAIFMLGCKIEDKLESTYESLVDFFLIRIV
jgi:hypothetical protein